jgi:hypothetical protein
MEKLFFSSLIRYQLIISRLQINMQDFNNLIFQKYIDSFK